MVNLGLIYLNGKRDTADEGRAWIESRTGEIVNMDRLITMKLPWTRVESVRDFLAVPKLPARPIVERNIAAYCSSYQSLVFPVISQSLFTETLDLAYGSHGPGVDSAKACVYAFLSVVAIFGLEKDLGDALDCETYALASQSFTVQIINEMTVDGLRALVMLTQHHYFLGDLQRAAVSVSMASRLVFKLGAHEGAGPTVYDRSLPECHLRDLFWLCYSFDQDICLRTGQPPSTAGVFCSLDLPTNYAQLQDTNLQHPEQTLTVTDATLPLYPWDLRLSRLKAEIYEALYSTTACQRSNSELVARIRSLDQALEHWRISLAREIRPTLHFSVGMSVDGKLNTQAVMLRLAYYHCVTIIHQATERHHDEPGICSSLSLAIRASRSSLAFLQTALPVVKGECFWVIIFYAITSILTLFRNILKNPLDPDMADLVAVLQGVPHLIREIPIRTLTVGPMIHLRFLNNFATELARLATCAIAKAEREVATSSVASHELPGP
ncbi:hypothetical protein BO86DRAFT_306209 [Aspergillus japonicus CBS 114.51]|uniref:Xylanolytic transcriptional activator regulatory domain-containing protein n=1 Tax=Aspergillus japonicus CBS 114.51 TaxID=1448312 RepID=A0A8T8X9J9_ASPJA|nr:hypothetical protein BO86DRAFT_306209 [Aspergillus japonicus CBS 114.51]RAH84788.1 hypothetical protein BO86DRAFT_306209 [Aspergillus japonicus CBS 114.51]